MFAANSKGVSIGAGSNGNPNITQAIGGTPPTAGYLVFDFENTSTITSGVHEDYNFTLGPRWSPDVRFTVTDAGLYAQTNTGFTQILSLAVNQWYSVRVAFDLTAGTYHGKVTAFGGAVTDIPTRTLAHTTAINELWDDTGLKLGTGAMPSRYLDNVGFVTGTVPLTPVPEPSTLALLAAGLAGLLAYAWRKRR